LVAKAAITRADIDLLDSLEMLDETGREGERKKGRSRKRYLRERT
jgi:hypothetical protein